MRTFGHYLVEQGVITKDQFEEATQSRVVFGGRLGTNLAELGYMRLEDIGRHLAKHLEVPLAPEEWLNNPSAEARKALAPELVEKHNVLPLRVEQRTLHLAMLDPRDPVQTDEIAFATGMRIVAYVVPEVQLLALLEHHYGLRREMRYINLGKEAAAGLTKKTASAEDSDQRFPELNPDAAEDMAPLGDSQDLIDEESFQSLHANSDPNSSTARSRATDDQTAEVPEMDISELEASPCVEPAPELAEDSIAALEVALVLASDRDAVSEIALRIARRYTEAAAIFIVRGGIISGFRGDGDAISEQISGILLPVASDCAITAPATSRTPFRGRPPEGGLDATLLTNLKRGDAREVTVFPITIRDQVVNLLYTDSGQNPLGETGFAALGALATLISRAYERLILERKAAIE
ncbi:MAG: hypothetical protein JRF15_08290 [Deltaproteobacteria bacterium]|jgi:hypothetical protein|nr:hypothetical protein [Deltaproteobacteria bacterium]